MKKFESSILSRVICYASGNKMHYIVQPRHLHYTDVMLYHVWFGLGLEYLSPGLGLELLSLESKPASDEWWKLPRSVSQSQATAMNLSTISLADHWSTCSDTVASTFIIRSYSFKYSIIQNASCEYILCSCPDSGTRFIFLRGMKTAKKIVLCNTSKTSYSVGSVYRVALLRTWQQ